MIIEGPPGHTNINIQCIYIFHNFIHIYEISDVHLSLLYMYLPCDEMFLYNKKLWCEIYFKYSWGLEA